jgi:putative hemolysin
MLALEIALVAALIVINGLLALSELAIVSSRRARLQAMAEKGISGARRALALHSDPGKLLSTVQIGITLVGVASGAISGTTLGVRLANTLMGWGVSDEVSEPLGIGLVVALITYFSLIIGELVPKQIALRNPEGVAAQMAPAMMLLSRIASPLVSILDGSGNAILWLLGYRAQAEQKVTDEEIRTIIAEAESHGTLEPGEREMISGVMRLADRPVRAVMTPRGEVDLVDLSDPPEAIRATITASPHSRLPAHDGNPDTPVGVLHVKDMLNACIDGGVPDVRSLVREAPVIPDSMDAHEVVDILKAAPVHMALVYDEYGHFLGLVTPADILEAIVGGFHTEEGPAEAAATKRDGGGYLLSGWMPADEFADLIGIRLPENRSYNTVAGFVLDELGTLPKAGDSFNAHGWRFEVLDVDGRRIDKIMATRLPATRRAAA